MKQRKELKKHTEGLNIGQAERVVRSREPARLPQELDRRVQKVQNGLIGGTRRSPGVRCDVVEEQTEIARSSLEKVIKGGVEGRGDLDAVAVAVDPTTQLRTPPRQYEDCGRR